MKPIIQLTYICLCLASAQSVIETPIFIKSKSGHLSVSQLSTGGNETTPEDIQSQIDQTIRDQSEVSIDTELFIGQYNQSFHVVMDTGSCDMWLLSRICENCPKNQTKCPRYDERNSTTNGFYDAIFDLHYGKGSTYGYWFWDTVCAVPGKCMPGFNFMNVGSQTNMLESLGTGSSGLIGLCHQHKSGTDTNNWSLWIDEMLKSNIIQQRVFSISVYDSQNHTSQASWGGYDMQKYAAKDAELEWHNVTEKSDFWHLSLQKMSISNSLNPKAEKQYIFGKNNSMIVDSGTSFLVMPHPDLVLLKDYLMYEQEMVCWFDKYGYITCECLFDNARDYFPDLTLDIDGKRYFIPKEEYLYQSKHGKCLVIIMDGGPQPFWILGLSNFFPNYYTVFDLDNNKIGFAPSKYANKRIGELYKQYGHDIDMIEDLSDNSSTTSGYNGAMMVAATVGLGLSAMLILRRKAAKDTRVNVPLIQKSKSSE